MTRSKLYLTNDELVNAKRTYNKCHYVKKKSENEDLKSENLYLKEENYKLKEKLFKILEVSSTVDISSLNSHTSNSPQKVE